MEEGRREEREQRRRKRRRKKERRREQREEKEREVCLLSGKFRKLGWYFVIFIINILVFRVLLGRLVCGNSYIEERESITKEKVTERNTVE